MSIMEVLTSRPQTKRALAFLMGWTTREVELEIQRYRVAGIPIVSNGDGYWLAQTPAEVEHCASALRRRAANQFVTARALRRAARRMAERSEPTLWQDVA